MDFWKSAGMHLVHRNEHGFLNVTDDYLRAYYTRPEIHPLEESCAAEHALFECLMQTPKVAITSAQIEAIEDEDARDNYRIILSFRDHLLKHQTIEAAYLALFNGVTISIPPFFIDQMVHIILRNIFEGVEDPMRLRAAELFFREQVITHGDDQLMLADHEIVEMQNQSGLGGLGQLLAEAGTPTREVALDVMGEDNKKLYWKRSDNFDMAVDFRFTQAAPDALGRVMEAWIFHFLKIKTRIQAVKSIRDEAWSWHIGCDAQSTHVLNALYEGKEVSQDELFNILALYQVEFLNSSDTIDTVRGKPIYLALSMNDKKRLLFKPQNLLTNLPIQYNMTTDTN